MSDVVEIGDLIKFFCTISEKFCGKEKSVPDVGDVGGAAEVEDFSKSIEHICNVNLDEDTWSTLSHVDLQIIVDGVDSLHTKRSLHLMSSQYLQRLLYVLDCQVSSGGFLSIEKDDALDSHHVSKLLSVLDSIRAAIALLTCKKLSKDLSNKEILQHMIHFFENEVRNLMREFDPSSLLAIEHKEAHKDNGSESKWKKSSSHKIRGWGSPALSILAHKLSTILVLLKDVMLNQRRFVMDSYKYSLLKTCFTTFSVENIHLLQLKAIVYISGIFYDGWYRSDIIEETCQLLCKALLSKRSLGAYYLPDEEEKQVCIITALLIQIIHCNVNIPDVLRQVSTGIPELEGSINAVFLSKCHEKVKDTCVHFWKLFLKRIETASPDDAAMLQVGMKNIVMDLLTTWNLPEYPASALMLEILCASLLENYGPESDDISMQCMSIDLIGLIATRLKHDALLFENDNFWMIQKLAAGDDNDHSFPTACSICSVGKVETPLHEYQCCQREFNADCLELREDPTLVWHCKFCPWRNQLLDLQSYCKSRRRDDAKSYDTSEEANMIIKIEEAQEILLKRLRDTEFAEMDLFSLRFYLYCLARFQSETVMRDSKIASLLFTRDSIKKLTLSLARNCSFSQMLTKILDVLLESLRDGSPIIKTKALRAVNFIVEVDPEVLDEREVESAVTNLLHGAVTVREATLELLGRLIASHADTGLKYFKVVAGRIKDTDASIRKSSIKIIRDMCTSNSNFSELTSACREIMSRATDNDSSVKDLVCETFYEFWFKEPSTSHTQLCSDSNPDTFEVANETEQIVKMLTTSNHQLFVTIVERNLALDFFPLSAKAAGIKPMLISSIRKRCELMCKYLMDTILQMEKKDDLSVKSRRLPYVHALHAFCVVDPKLWARISDFSQFWVILQSYLNNQVDSQAVEPVKSIIALMIALLHLAQPPLSRTKIDELEQDLKHFILGNRIAGAIKDSIKCLCLISKVAEKGTSVVENLIQQVLQRLHSSGLDEKEDVILKLYRLNALIRSGSSLLNLSQNSIAVTNSFVMLKNCFKDENLGVKYECLCILSFILTARPACMLEEDMKSILEAALSSKCNRFKAVAIHSIYMSLITAENQMETERTSGRNNVPVAVGGGDTNICREILQSYVPLLSARISDDNNYVQNYTLKILEVNRRQGF